MKELKAKHEKQIKIYMFLYVLYVGGLLYYRMLMLFVLLSNAINYNNKNNKPNIIHTCFFMLLFYAF